MPEADILIVGGGPAGLSSAGALKQAGLDPVILDGGERIGQSWESRYERLHLHTERAFSGLAYYPIPRRYPKYLSKDQYAAYLREYAAYFNLDIKPRSVVKRVRQVNGNGQPGWAVEEGAQTWQARVVVIATGAFGQPVCPNWPSQVGFRGEIIHSSQYHSGSAYRNRRVLVIGAGNSGLEIAVDLAEQGASQAAVSIRSGPPIVPRDFLGVSAQMFAILMKPFPRVVSDRIAVALSRLALGDLRHYEMPAPGWLPFTAHRTPVIDVGFTTALKTGRVRLRPAVQSFTPDGVIFEDDRKEPFDAVILATGFRTGLEQILEPAGLLDEHGNPRFPSGLPTSCPGLFFMGYYDTLRGFLYESNLASRRLAGVIKPWLSG